MACARRFHWSRWLDDLGSLAKDLRCALDPCEIFRECVGEPDRWQEKLLTSNAKRALLLCSRQAGKSAVSAILGLHTALFTAGALVLLVSPSLRQSSELFRRVISAYRVLEPNGVDVEQESALRLEFRNGSRVIALPASEHTVRGYSAADLLIVDEAARVSDDLLAAVRPTLATRKHGRLIMLSTPFGKRGAYYAAWTSGEGWERVSVTASECPRISREFLEAERRELGDFIYRQEYEPLEFLDNETALFDSALIEAAMSSEVQPLWN